MKLTVMKFGGSSVADANKIKLVARRIIAKKNEGGRVIAVVSAQGDTTDDLLEAAAQITANPPPREMDVLLSTGEMISISLLSMAIDSMGEKVLSLTGPQAGILTDENHQKAKIVKIDVKKMKSALNKYPILIVAGFQGQNPKGDIATLGRGGSDLTAVAIAAAMKADSCEIYSDVEGVFTTDPRAVKEAKKLDFLSYDEMLELAGSGAQVLQSRSVEVAKKFNVIIKAGSSFSENQGTII
ncbi:MAG: aspartate kinase, partial [Elusimicrobiota bacterium]|nr:aspartate kinase [Elusimicrobiota bacterium]